MLFSERYGYQPVRSVVQIEYIDDELRNRLWNVLSTYYWDQVKVKIQYNRVDLELTENSEMNDLVKSIWDSYFRKSYDSMPRRWYEIKEFFQKFFFNCVWYEVYNFIGFIINHHPRKALNESFITACNKVLKEELSGYRICDLEITPITSDEEIAEIEEALQTSDALSPVSTHLRTALSYFADKQNPDYRNSIKESISAVEAICRLITKNRKATLGKALNQIEKAGRVKLHNALKEGLEKIYGYSSDEDGIRHSLLDDPNLDFEDAKFMLVSCSAFINYLKVKSSKAEITL